MQITIGPVQKRDKRLRLLLMPTVASVVVGYFALGPMILIVAGVTALFVLALVWSGPRVNEKIYGGRRSADAILSTPAAFEHRSGRLTVLPGSVRWTPSHPRSGPAGFIADLAEVVEAEVQSVSKVPPSCSLVCRLPDQRISLTVFADAGRLLKALRQASGG